MADFINPVIVKTVLLLALSNCFMTYAWYGHLKHFEHKSWLLAVVVSWGIAFFEYLIQVPANRIGHEGHLTLAQLKIQFIFKTLKLLTNVLNKIIFQRKVYIPSSQAGRKESSLSRCDSSLHGRAL